MTPEQLRSFSREQRLAWFARQVLSETWDGLNVEADDIHQWALAAGLIHAERVTPDTDTAGITNSECLELGDTFYREARDLLEALPPHTS